jgi:hypothetical protein
MPATPQAHALALSFQYLRSFRLACSFNTSASSEDLCTFAYLKILDVLPTTPYQKQFEQAANNSTGLAIDDNDLKTLSTFLDLVNDNQPLDGGYGKYLMSMAAGNFPSGTLTEFEAALASDAFPGGSGGALWKAVVAELTDLSENLVPDECFTNVLQMKLGTALDTTGTKMQSIITTIAGLK